MTMFISTTSAHYVLSRGSHRSLSPRPSPRHSPRNSPGHTPRRKGSYGSHTHLQHQYPHQTLSSEYHYAHHHSPGHTPPGGASIPGEGKNVGLVAAVMGIVGGGVGSGWVNMELAVIDYATENNDDTSSVKMDTQV